MMGADAEAAGAALKEALPLPPSGFVISKTRGGKLRRLHFIPDCRLIPGVHYAHYDVWGEVAPPAAEVTHTCGICMPQGLKVKELEQALAESPLHSASSSSSGDEAPDDAPSLAVAVTPGGDTAAGDGGGA